ncbi:protein of unknown function [Methylococcus capsulatus]|uniref:Uncharacterized protein n=1 Tax=Methylococcus capsulatus TaxID=414 RepID=A0AA35UCE5_METCP|nr:protein of unknown function [Methylococcus capsulatus]
MSSWSTTITSEAMITICAMIRTLLGMWLRIKAMPALEQAVTEVSARLMIKAVDNCEVTAKAEQMPSTWRVMGLLSTSGSMRTFFDSSFMGINLFQL